MFILLFILCSTNTNFQGRLNGAVIDLVVSALQREENSLCNWCCTQIRDEYFSTERWKRDELTFMKKLIRYRKSRDSFLKVIHKR